MKKFAVAWISFFDNVLELYIVEAENWRAAVEKAKPGYFESIPDSMTIEEAAAEAFNQDWTFNVVPIE